ncbi:HNH endonuclease [Halobacteriovorax sp. GB3]|uniref:HNH endonuclease n=1 Tax=Halobacteriovorax sp. GB3 TaxID=2719615 RepID=UPI0023619B5F|nr:HNH endonuclease [Halobacteriovorax sp. GB3]MDD0852799.1 HNH endonuclease [Halobacteriovorax sp. GB3]
MRTLLLDNSYFPVQIVSWQKAILLLFTGRAEVVDEYEEHHIQTVSSSYPRPKILRLFSRHQTSRSVKFSRQNVFLRDNYTCQYCFKPFPHQQLTFDHVIPQSKGGPTSWQNIVTCCQRCNNKKGNKLLSEMGIKLQKIPSEPDWHPTMCLKLKNDDPKEWFDWLRLKKKEESLCA